VTIRVIIPVKGPANGKTRLAGVLDEAARARLIGAMLDRVVAAARGARTIHEICLLGTSDFRSTERVTWLADPGGGLNAALTSALARSGDVARLVILHADLPLIGMAPAPTRSRCRCRRLLALRLHLGSAVLRGTVQKYRG
jgi:2-phospho-L-lactate guanylyltransferase